MEMQSQIGGQILNTHEKKHLREQSKKESWLPHEGLNLNLLFFEIGFLMDFAHFGINFSLLLVVAEE